MLLKISRGVANGNSYCYWSVDCGQLFEGGIYHDREWSAILGKQVTIKENNSASVEVVLGAHSKCFDFEKVYLFVNKPIKEILKELRKIRKEVITWFDTIDKHESFALILDLPEGGNI